MSIAFHDHEIVQRMPTDYIEITISPDKILRAWRLSLFAHELLNNDGSLKHENQMNGDTLLRYVEISNLIKQGETLPKPVIGIGIMDNLEIGIGREIVAAAAQHHITEIPVHMRKAQAIEIQKLL